MKTKSQRGAATRQRLVVAASELMGRRGFHGTSVDDVLTESTAGKSQFYHYFDSKQALVGALLEHHAKAMPLLRLAAACEGTSFERLEAELDQLVVDFEAGCYPNGCTIGNLGAELAGEASLCQVMAPAFETAVTQIADLIKRMRYRGHVRSDIDAQQAAYLLASSLQGAFLLARLARDSLPLKGTAAQLKAYMKSLSSRAPARTNAAARPFTVHYCP